MKFCITFIALIICAEASFSQKRIPVVGIIPNLSDSALLDVVERQTFRYFWDFAHPVSGLARERSNITNYGPETVTIGGSGFGVMAVIVAAERKWISRDTAAGHILKMVRFLRNSDVYHGAYPHWMNGETGRRIPFSPKDDGGDLVETSYLFQGLLCAREYFNGDNPKENELRRRITWLWNEVEWNWYTRGGLSMLTLGTGVGGAILIDGRPYQGAFNKAGHFGHMVINDEGDCDITGMPGSLEDCIGNCTIEKRSKGKFSSTQEMLIACNDGDNFAKDVWLKSVKQLAIGLASITNILSPEIIVLGGGIAEAGNVLFEPLHEYMAEFEWRVGGNKVEIVKAFYGDLAGTLGAASFALSKICH